MDTCDKRKEIGVQRAWTKRREKERKPWLRENKRMVARERESFDIGEKESAFINAL